jgi:hypothetical protein
MTADIHLQAAIVVQEQEQVQEQEIQSCSAAWEIEDSLLKTSRGRD